MCLDVFQVSKLSFSLMFTDKYTLVFGCAVLCPAVQWIKKCDLAPKCGIKMD